jgi:hypothetical protein
LILKFIVGNVVKMLHNQRLEHHYAIERLPARCTFLSCAQSIL